MCPLEDFTVPLATSTALPASEPILRKGAAILRIFCSGCLAPEELEYPDCSVPGLAAEAFPEDPIFVFGCIVSDIASIQQQVALQSVAAASQRTESCSELHSSSRALATLRSVQVAEAASQTSPSACALAATALPPKPGASWLLPWHVELWLKAVAAPRELVALYDYSPHPSRVPGSRWRPLIYQ